ncbi:MAPEG family protein [Aliiglaciecola litoralis]|uniref:MAPEG family protein n=1 Tax=Aliiglaciecola litoralis TaxID=582857 RepID=A0ABN1LCA6_9ALTE
MYTPTLITLMGFIGWALFLLVLMEAIRSKMVIFKQVAPNGFNPNNSNLSAFMQRLARAHANCIEGLPIFGGLMLVAIVTSNTSVTDELAFLFLAARIIQSLFHLASLSSLVVTLRFTAFTVQMGIAVYWFYTLFSVILS